MEGYKDGEWAERKRKKDGLVQQARKTEKVRGRNWKETRSFYFFFFFFVVVAFVCFIHYAWREGEKIRRERERERKKERKRGEHWVEKKTGGNER